MCGIVGYIGQNDAYPVLIEGLKKLEYRGYDSAGVALINSEDQLNVYKTKGKVINLEQTRIVAAVSVSLIPVGLPMVNLLLPTPILM